MMLRQLKTLTVALGVGVLCCLGTVPSLEAGWGHHHHQSHHHHGHHHHHGFYGGGLYGGGLYGGFFGTGLYRNSFYGSGLYGGWGFPRYGWGRSYTSLSINIGLPRYRSYYWPSYRSYGFYSAPYFSRVSAYAVPSYSVPSVYYAPATYYAPYAPSTYYVPDPCYSAPVGDCMVCDPNSTYVDPAYSGPTVYAPASPTPSLQAPSVVAPSDATPGYSTEFAPQVRGSTSGLLTTNSRSGTTAGSMTAGGSMVDRMLGRASAPAARTSSFASMQTVSTAKPVVSDLATVQFPSEYRPLPASLLKSADALFAAGGYREAASAYAHLTVHYGNHDELAVRRFLALVASGDCSQAAVLFELASASEQPLLVSALPGGGLMELYGVHAQQRQTHVEYLADYALKNPNDSVALAMVGTWLELDDQPERAQPFFQQAAKLSPESALPGSTPIVASRLVLTDSAR